MTGRVLSPDELLGLGVYEDTGQKDRDGKRVVRISFSTLAGKITVKNEIMNYVKTKRQQIIELKGAAEKAALTSHQEGIKKLQGEIELLELMIREISYYYGNLDAEFKNRHLELEEKLKDKIIIETEGNTLH